MKEAEELREKIKNKISQLINDRDTEEMNSTAFNPYGHNFAISELRSILVGDVPATYNDLVDIIEHSPVAKVISTGDIVVCVTHDRLGVLCEDEEGLTSYTHRELTLI